MTTTHSTSSAPLRRSRDAVLPRLRAAVESMDASSASMASYHFGWTTTDGQPLVTDGGKWLRPTLALLSARTCDTPAEFAVPAAAAVELVHNFSLIHDDVMDRDVERHHRPTVWAVWGVSNAILTGDAMLVAAQRVVLESGSPHAVAATRLLLEATRELIRGQTEDLEFETRDDVSLEDCREMAAAKTGALLAASAAIGAVIGGASEATVDALTRYGTHLGAAFQLVDDLLGIWGDPSVTGKPVLADLRRHKKSLPVVYALTHGGSAGRELAEWLAKPETDDESELARAAAIVESAGGRRWAAEEAQRLVAEAISALDCLADRPEVVAELSELARFVVARQS